jgi:hypothetical protein
MLSQKFLERVVARFRLSLGGGNPGFSFVFDESRWALLPLRVCCPKRFQKIQLSPLFEAQHFR